MELELARLDNLESSSDEDEEDTRAGPQVKGGAAKENAQAGPQVKGGAAKDDGNVGKTKDGEQVLPNYKPITQ